MKTYTVRRTLLALSIAGCLVPGYAQSQSTGNGSFSSPRGDNSTIAPNPSGSSPTQDLRPHSDMPKSTMPKTTPSPNDPMHSQLGSSEKNNNQTQDKGLTDSDNGLNNRIRTAFNSDSAMREATQEVSLQSNNGTVTLNGTVATEKEKSDLENRVQHMTGVKQVINNLQIAPHAHNSTLDNRNTIR